MIYYEISFPLTLAFKLSFVKILLLMMFISISIPSQVFERSDRTITVHNDYYYNELVI